MSTISAASDLEPIPVTITGSLAPLTIAINGQVLVKQDKSVDGISINGHNFKKKELAGKHKAFYLSVDDQKIEIATITKEEKSPPLIFEMPTATAIEVREEGIFLQVGSPNYSLKIDNQELKGSGLVRNTHPSQPSGPDDKWFDIEHELALKDPKTGVESLYLMKTRGYIPPQPVNRGEIAPICMPPFHGGGTGLCLNYDYIWPNRWVLGAMFHYQMPFNTSDGYSRGEGLSLRGGYQILRQNNGPKAPTYFEAGLGAGPYWGTTTFYNTTGGGTNDQSATGFRYYLYLETIPIRFGYWGLGLGIEPGWATNNYINDFSVRGFLSYNW